MSEMYDDDFLEPSDLHVLLQRVVDAARGNQDLYRRTQFTLSRIMREFDPPQRSRAHHSI